MNRPASGVRTRWLGFALSALVMAATATTGGCKKKAARDPDALPIDQAHPPERVPGATPIATLERTGCYGECPVYRFTVNSDGTVVYVGTRWVKVLGRQQYQISAAQLAELDAAFDRVNFMALRDFDRVESTDEDWAHVSWTHGGRTKRVRHYHGDATAPAGLSPLEDELDRIVDSGRFVGLPNVVRNAPAASAAASSPGAPLDSTKGVPSSRPSDSGKALEHAGPPDETPTEPETQ